jgi:hypothetical protein
VVPGPRPSDGLDQPSSLGAGRSSASPGCPAAAHLPRIALTRTTRGWAVVPLPADAVPADCVEDLVQGMTLADLVADELGTLPEPDRTARRSARGPVGVPADVDPLDARIAALQRTVTQLEHALAARVSTERAIGVLAERHGSSARAAFEMLRREARTQGRPVVELAREVLDGLAHDHPGTPEAAPAPAGGASPLAPRAFPVTSGAAADGRT